MRKIRGWEFEGVVPWEAVIEVMQRGPQTHVRDVVDTGPEPRELRCQCCGGYAGHGVTDPEYCGSCRRAGEHEQ